MLKNAYLLARIGADTAENERSFGEKLPKIGDYPTGPQAQARCHGAALRRGGRGPHRAPSCGARRNAGGTTGGRAAPGLANLHFLQNLNFANIWRARSRLYQKFKTANFCKKICAWQHLSSSTRFASFCTAAISKFSQKIGLKNCEFRKISENFRKFWQILLIFWKNVILELCKGVQCVDLGESFPTNICLQKLASIQPRTSPSKSGSYYSIFFNRVLTYYRGGGGARRHVDKSRGGSKVKCRPSSIFFVRWSVSKLRKRTKGPPPIQISSFFDLNRGGQYGPLDDVYIPRNVDGRPKGLLQLYGFSRMLELL